jgi:hypothetical protein
MKTFHSTEWSRSVYSTLWICRICSDGSLSFSDAKEFELHLGTSHGTLTEIQKTVRIKRSKTRALRDQWICPLCECVPPQLSKIQNRNQDPEIHTHFGRHVAAHTKALSLLAFRFLPWTQDHSAHDDESSDDNRSVEALLPNDDYERTLNIHSGTSRGSSIGSTAFQDIPIDDRGYDEPRGISNDGENLETTPPPMQGSGSGGFLPTFRDLEEQDASPQEPDVEPQQQISEALSTTWDALMWIDNAFLNDYYMTPSIGVDIVTVRFEFQLIKDSLMAIQHIQQRSPSDILPTSVNDDNIILRLREYIKLVNWYRRLVDWISQYLWNSDLADKPLFKYLPRTPEGYWLWCPFCDRESSYSSTSITDCRTHIATHHQGTLPPEPWTSLARTRPPRRYGDHYEDDPQIRLTLLSDLLRSIAAYREEFEGLSMSNSEVSQKTKDEVTQAESIKSTGDAPIITEGKQEDLEVKILDIPQRESMLLPRERALSDLSVSARNRPPHTIGLWPDGFTVDNGPLHLIGEGQNREIIDSLDQGRAFSKAVLASLPPDWPDLDSTIVISRQRRPPSIKQQSKRRLILPWDPPYINPSPGHLAIPRVSTNLDDEDKLLPGKQTQADIDQVDDSTGSSTSVELDPDIKEHSPSEPNDALTAPPPVSL